MKHEVQIGGSGQKCLTLHSRLSKLVAYQASALPDEVHAFSHVVLYNSCHCLPLVTGFRFTVICN